MLAAANFCKAIVDLRAFESKATPHLTRWLPSKLSHGQEVGCFFMLLLYTSFIFPFSLCPSFPPNTTKYCFSLRFQLGSGMMSSGHTLCGPDKSILPGASFEREPGLLNSLFMLPQGNLHFSFVQTLFCLWGQ